MWRELVSQLQVIRVCIFCLDRPHDAGGNLRRRTDQIDRAIVSNCIFGHAYGAGFSLLLVGTGGSTIIPLLMFGAAARWGPERRGREQTQKTSRNCPTVGIDAKTGSPSTAVDGNVTTTTSTA